MEIGIPAPQGFIPIIPKYVTCASGPWATPGSKFCRVIENYGPTGVSKAINTSQLSQRYDPNYGSNMPYVEYHDVTHYVNPRRALEAALRGSSPLQPFISRVAAALSKGLTGLDQLGLTGSAAVGMEQRFSDVDFTVYGNEAAEALYELFTSRARAVECKSEFGGVTVRGYSCTPWRRGFVGDSEVPVSWVGVPNEVAGHCNVLRRYENLSPPSRDVEVTVTIPPRQPMALLYPPCVASEEGYVVVSYEFNLGGPLYEGGVVRLVGRLLGDGKTVVLGSRERPGMLELLEKSKV